MGKEIERKFLIRNTAWQQDATSGTVIKQGYLNFEIERTVRVRIKGKKGFLTIKGKSVGMSRAEFEYEIPLLDAEELLKMCKAPIIEKKRYIIPMGRLKWEIDIFSGQNQGLELAEIELENETQTIDFPEWIGKEITSDSRYYNSQLAKHPFQQWS